MGAVLGAEIDDGVPAPAAGAVLNMGDSAHAADAAAVATGGVLNAGDGARAADAANAANAAEAAEGRNLSDATNAASTLPDAPLADAATATAAVISAEPNAQEPAAETATERPRTVLLIAVCKYSDSSALWTVMVRDSNGRLAFPSCPHAPDTTARKALAYGMQVQGIASCGLLLAPYHRYRLTQHFTLDEPERDSRGTTTAVYTARFHPRNMPAERGDPAAPGSVVILKMADVLMHTDLASDHLMALIMVLGGCNGHEPLPGGIRMLADNEQHLTAQMKTGFNGGPYPGNQVALDTLVSAYAMHSKRNTDDDSDDDSDDDVFCA